MNSLLRRRCVVLLAAVLFSPPSFCAVSAPLEPTIDQIVFGQIASEQQHAFHAEHSEVFVGTVGEHARRLLPIAPDDWRGGRVAFTLKIDPEKQNYITVRLSGAETSPDYLILVCDGKQLGYRHLGDISVLDTGSDEPAADGHFFYTTTPLPLALTRGRTQLPFEIRSTGAIWGYGQTFDKYQKPMTAPTRGIYRVATHTNALYVPAADEKQVPPSVTPTVRTEPGPEMLDLVKQRVNRELTQLLTSKTPPHQMQMQFLARAWSVAWTPAFHNPQVVARVIAGADKLVDDFKKDPHIAENGPASWNPDWFGLGPVGDSFHRLAAELAPRLDEKMSDGRTRRAAWSEMLVSSREWHRRHRRLYTNQTMINDLFGIYLSNRGVTAIDPTHAAPEAEMRRYLYESIGLQPWTDSDAGGHSPAEREGRKNWAAGADYWQLTQKGLTRELGYVGNYGEVLDWMTALYDATRPSPDQPGDQKIKAQLVKAGHARAAFRYPALDADGHRAMRLETIVGWRDVHFPGEVTYAQRTAWDGSAIQAATATLDPKLIGAAQQMVSDNQYFSSVRDRMKTAGLRVTIGLLDTPDEYDRLKAQPPHPERLPMSPGSGNAVFTDEENGVIALKHGEEILYVSLYWRARYAVNFLARIHHITPSFERIAIAQEETEFESSGLNYTRPNWTNFGFGNGGLRYPDELNSAHAGEVQPIAKIPTDVGFKPGDESVYAGKGSFYTLRYGNYLIAMNSTTDSTRQLAWPPRVTTARDLVSGKTVSPDERGSVAVAPRSTVVLWLGDSK